MVHSGDIAQLVSTTQVGIDYAVSCMFIGQFDESQNRKW